ncbi:unnamed protein product [Linum tenue]|uniref:LOB domain-containing protein n=1 Tax=Linum tenue TaxID=586396 RepID=A0AAV0HHR5_9ROSI|nr:unnamed protein product [Linum tenue]
MSSDPCPSNHGRPNSSARRSRSGVPTVVVGSKRSAASAGDNNNAGSSSAAAAGAPCGACKFLRRKCVSGCIFAPHFGSDQGAARFAAVHKVFGASNVSKLLLHVPVNRRNEAVVTISYEAQARLSDPVLGCVSTILTLQQQVASLQAELAMVQNQLINSRYAMANVLHQQEQQQQQQQQQVAFLQPAYSNNSSASTNLLNLSSFTTTTSNFDLVPEPAAAVGIEPLHITLPSQNNDEDDEEESHIIPGCFR